MTDADAEITRLTRVASLLKDQLSDALDRQDVLENALKWVRFRAGLHMLGGAFNPEHMRDLANLAADAIAGRRPELPDLDEAWKSAQEEGTRLAAWFAEMEEGTEDGGA